jgi:hypothetical protein
VSQQLGALQIHTTDTFLFISHTTNVLLFKFRIIKEMPGSVASETHCIYYELCVISDFPRDTNEICAFLGFYAAWNPRRAQISYYEVACAKSLFWLANIAGIKKKKLGVLEFTTVPGCTEVKSLKGTQ